MKALVVGGSGNLGKSFILSLNRAGLIPINVDIYPNSDANTNILVDPNVKFSLQIPNIINSVQSNLAGGNLSCVLSSAGGYRTGTIADDDFIENIMKMHEINVETAALAAHLGSKFLMSKGLLLLIGASAALHPLPNDIGYGLSKSATHYLTQSAALDEKFISKKICALGILPQVIRSNKLSFADSTTDSNDGYTTVRIIG